MAWTESEKEKLAELWPLKTSYEIAEELGKSRDAVTGQATRLGLKKDDGPPAQRAKAQKVKSAPSKEKVSHDTDKPDKAEDVVTEQDLSEQSSETKSEEKVFEEPEITQQPFVQGTAESSEFEGSSDEDLFDEMFPDAIIRTQKKAEEPKPAKVLASGAKIISSVEKAQSFDRARSKYAFHRASVVRAAGMKKDRASTYRR